MHACNPSSQEVEAGEPKVQEHPWIHSSLEWDPVSREKGYHMNKQRLFVLYFFSFENTQPFAHFMYICVYKYCTTYI